MLQLSKKKNLPHFNNPCLKPYKPTSLVSLLLLQPVLKNDKLWAAFLDLFQVMRLAKFRISTCYVSFSFLARNLNNGSVEASAITRSAGVGDTRLTLKKWSNAHLVRAQGTKAGDSLILAFLANPIKPNWR